MADGKIVKICDFGLSRQMYENSYKKTNKVRPNLFPNIGVWGHMVHSELKHYA